MELGITEAACQCTPQCLARIPAKRNRFAGKDSRQISMLEQILIAKVFNFGGICSKFGSALNGVLKSELRGPKGQPAEPDPDHAGGGIASGSSDPFLLHPGVERFPPKLLDFGDKGALHI
jgi:hypothetical protein